MANMVGPNSYWIGDEDVRGVIIGAMKTPYRFFRKVKRLSDNQIVDEPITGMMYFENDDEAEAWIKENHPGFYALGVEIRIYDQP